MKDYSITKESEISRRKPLKKDQSDLLSMEGSDYSNKKRPARQKKSVRKESLGYNEKETPIKTAGIKGTLSIKCEKVLNQIKNHPLAEMFYHPIDADYPSLAKIERNIKDNKYKSAYDFGLDLRKLWSFYFSNYAGNPSVYQKVCVLSQLSEDLIQMIEQKEETKNDMTEIKHKLDKIAEEVSTIKGKPVPHSIKKQEKTSSILDKPMSIAEKNALGNSIRELTPEQLKGIVTLLSDSMTIDQKSKYFEFDIDTLPTRKLRELERYVKNCLRSNKGVSKNVPKKEEINVEDRVAQLKVVLYLFDLIE